MLDLPVDHVLGAMEPGLGGTDQAKHLEGRANRRERVAQLVGQHGQEVVLPAARRLGLGPCLLGYDEQPLTLVRRLVELHGGRVEAGSPGRGHGSEFVVRLPLARPTMPPVGTEERSEPPEPAATASVLLVEDNVDAAESLVMYLELRGYRVKIAPDGPTALRLAQASPPDAAIVDIGLPGMDGFEVARRLRGDVGLGKMLLVALTGYGSEEDRRRAFAAGFDAHLLKPVDPDALHALLARDRNGRAVGEKTRTVH